MSPHGVKKSFAVLAVEEESAYGHLLEHALSPLPVSVKLLPTAPLAREYLKGCPFRSVPDAVVLDFKLLQASGLELLRWIRTQPAIQSLPVVVLSGCDDASDVNRAYELGVEAYVTRPGRLRDLAMMLSGVLVTRAPVRRDHSIRERSPRTASMSAS